MEVILFMIALVAGVYALGLFGWLIGELPHPPWNDGCEQCKRENLARKLNPPPMITIGRKLFRALARLTGHQQQKQ